jgi:hypothetical protein
MGFVDAMGPVPSRARAASKGVNIAFDYAEGLFLEGAQSCVECCQQRDAFQLEIVTGNGEKRLVNASAAVTGTSMVTVTPQEALTTGSTIVAVRYAVIDVPQCVIYNSAGMPSNPFVLSVEAAAAEMMPFGLAHADSKKVSSGSVEQAPALKLPPMVRLLVLRNQNLLHEQTWRRENVLFIFVGLFVIPPFQPPFSRDELLHTSLLIFPSFPSSLFQPHF